MTPISILYVEDNDDLRHTIAAMLEGDDRVVVACANGKDALETLGTREFDVLVTDVSLPDINGTDLARRALTDDSNRWVVLCSGYEFGRELTQSGPNVRSLSKSFEVEDLEALMNEITASVRSRLTR